MKNLLIAAGVLLAVLLTVYFINRPRPLDPQVQRLADLTELAERSCLSNTSDTSSVSLRVKMEAIKKIDGSASIQQQRTAARGAAEALAGEMQAQENTQIRTCMEPWSKQLREMAARM